MRKGIEVKSVILEVQKKIVQNQKDFKAVEAIAQKPIKRRIIT